MVYYELVSFLPTHDGIIIEFNINALSHLHWCPVPLALVEFS